MQTRLETYINENINNQENIINLHSIKYRGGFYKMKKLIEQGKSPYFIKSGKLVLIENIKTESSLNKYFKIISEEETKKIHIYMLEPNMANTINKLRDGFDDLINSINETFKTMTYSIAEGDKKGTNQCIKILDAIKKFDLDKLE
ncbi:hypothetical protein M0Q50_10690 [bacterium]|jgi:hypothetical protein|nr:hypothetical protein [bacterium]